MPEDVRHDHSLTSEQAVLVGQIYTTPRTWGVYEARRGAAVSHHLGNHPVRMRELRREYDGVRLLYLYLDRDSAVACKAKLTRR